MLTLKEGGLLWNPTTGCVTLDNCLTSLCLFLLRQSRNKEKAHPQGAVGVQ